MKEKKQKPQKLVDNFSKIGILVIVAIIVVIALLCFFNGNKREYNVTFDTNGGSLVESIVVKKNETISEPEDPIKENYEFLGWYYNDELYDFDEPVSKDLKLEAKWGQSGKVSGVKLNKANLDLYIGEIFHLSAKVQPDNISNNGVIWESSAPDVVSVDSDGNIRALKVGTSVIKVTTKDGNYSAQATVTVKSKKTNIKSYVVEFMDGMTLLDKQKVKSGSIITRPTNPIKEGYTFKGWYIEDVEYTFTDRVTKDIQLTAKWEKNIYEVKFVSDDTILDSINVEHGNVVSKPTEPTKEGHTFKGWYNGDVEYTFTEEVTDNIELTVKWEKNKYKIIFLNYDGTTLEIKDVEYGIVPTYTGNQPIKVGNKQYSYVFTGWTPSLEETSSSATYVAVYETVINKYKVTFVNDGKVMDTINVEYGSVASEPSEPTKEGHTFKGWYNGNTEYTFIEEVTDNIKLTAKWEKNKYKVTFVSEGKTLETVNVEYGNVVSKPINPTKENYTFKGWYNGNTEYKFTEKVTENLELTAKWEKNKYKVEFISEDTVLETINVEHGNVVSRPNDPIMEGHIFKGWYNGNTEYTFTEEVTNDIKITAKWEKKKYKVTFVNGDSTLEISNIEYGSLVPKIGEPTKVGHTFKGWYNGNTEYKFTEKVAGNLVLTAKWEKNKYKITFVNYDGKTLEIKDVEYGTVPTYTGKEPVKVGNKQYSYVFTGWTPSLVATTEVATYTATYKEVVNKYKVTFVSDGKTLETKDIEYGTVATKPTNPTKTGYTFKGWYNGNTEYTFTEKVTGNLELTAKWEKNKYKITFVNYDGKILEEKDVEYGTVPTYTGKEPVKVGNKQYSYVFTGWTPSLVVATEVATYTATYKEVVNKYKVTFVSDGKTLETKDIEYGKVATKPTNPTKEHYTFKGWYNGDKEYTFTEKVTDDIQLTAKWEKNKYKVTYVSDGKTLETVTVEYGSVVSKPTNPTKIGHIFKGWYNGNTEYKFTEKVSGNLELTAKWEKNKYKITFVNYDGKVLETKDVEYGTIPTYTGSQPVKPKDSKNSYVFIGWTPSLVATTEAATYTATYKEAVNTYKVTFISDGKTLETKEVEYGKVVTKPTNPTKEHYTFKGWYNGDKEYTFTEKVTDDIQLTAKWEKNKYKVTYVSDGKTLETVTVEYGSVVTKPTNPTKEHYTFKGWYNGNTEYKFTEKVTGNLELTAKWEKNKYKITFVNYDGKTLETKDVEYGTIPTYTKSTPVKPKDSKNSYVFVGWTPSLTEATKATTYTAVYEILVDLDTVIKSSLSEIETKKFYIENSGNAFNIKFTSYTTTNIFGRPTTKYPPYKFIDLFSDVVNFFDALSANNNYESFELYYKHPGDANGKSIDLTKYNLKDSNLSSWYGNGANDKVGDWIGYLAKGEASTGAAYKANSNDLVGKTITITVKLKDGYVNKDGSDTAVYYLSFYNA